MKYLKAIFAVPISILIIFAASQSYASETPSGVVAEFCKLDFEGHRLSSAAYEPIKPLIMYLAEPGWDIVLGVHSYELSSETIEGNIAKVIVHYEIDRSWPVDIGDISKYKTETFMLAQENGFWKISKYIQFPRVSSELLCSKYKYCTTGS